MDLSSASSQLNNSWVQKNNLVQRRKLKNQLFIIGALGITGLLLLVLFSILAILLINGLSGLSLFTLSHMTAPQGIKGGLLNPILGSLFQTGLAIFLAIPIGVLAGIFLAEYGNTRMVSLVRFISDMLMSAPSILVGLFIYTVIVIYLGYSAFAGICALAILAIPLIVRTTEDTLRLIPTTIREAGFALGAPKWKVIIFVCLPIAKGGIMTGILLAISRIVGEAAPLLFTSLGNSDWSWNIFAPMTSLPLIIYQYADSADDQWVQLAWTAALLITMAVLCLNIVAKSYLEKGLKNKRK